MANTTENRINTTITDAKMTAIETGFADINTAMNGSTVALTEDERKSLFSLDVANKEFAADCLAQGALLMAQLPPALQTIVSNLKNDLTLSNQCEKIENTLILPLMLRNADTKRIAAHEGYVGALALYKVIEAMAGMGIEGFQAAYDVLKKRFDGQGGRPTTPV
ncbi:MAG: hypothetical protein WCP52_06935 [Bacteroidota bacterium]